MPVTGAELQHRLLALKTALGPDVLAIRTLAVR